MKLSTKPWLFIGIMCCACFIASAVPAAHQETVSASNQQIIYSGNTKSRKYHHPSCEYYTCKNCNRRFTSAEDAAQQGYQACKVCSKSTFSVPKEQP